jgi:hypothetical protein
VSTLAVASGVDLWHILVVQKLQQASLQPIDIAVVVTLDRQPALGHHAASECCSGSK